MEFKTSNIFASAINYLNNDEPAAALGGTPAAPADGLDATVSFEASAAANGVATDATSDVALARLTPPDAALAGAKKKTAARVDHFPTPMRASRSAHGLPTLDAMTHTGNVRVGGITRELGWEQARVDVNAKKTAFNTTIDTQSKAVSKAMDKDLGKMPRLSAQQVRDLQFEIGAYKTARAASNSARDNYGAARSAVVAAEHKLAQVEARRERENLEAGLAVARNDLDTAKDESSKRANRTAAVVKAMVYAASGSPGDAEAEVADLLAREVVVAGSADEIARVQARIDDLERRIGASSDKELKEAWKAAIGELEVQQKVMLAAAREYVASEREVTRALDRLVTLERPCGTTVFKELRAYRTEVGKAGVELYEQDRAYVDMLEGDIVDPQSQFAEDTKAAVDTLRKKEASRVERGEADPEPETYGHNFARITRHRVAIKEWALEESDHEQRLIGALQDGAHLTPVDGAVDRIYDALGGTPDEKVIPTRGS